MRLSLPTAISAHEAPLICFSSQAAVKTWRCKVAVTPCWQDPCYTYINSTKILFHVYSIEQLASQEERCGLEPDWLPASVFLPQSFNMLVKWTGNSKLTVDMRERVKGCVFWTSIKLLPNKYAKNVTVFLIEWYYVENCAWYNSTTHVIDYYCLCVASLTRHTTIKSLLGIKV